MSASVGPGSREPSPAVSALSGFDPSRVASLIGPAYSPNLRKWVSNRRNAGRLLFVYRDPANGWLYIGRRDDEDGWFYGARLMRVLTTGSRAETFAYTPKHCGSWELLPDFWSDYERRGRCAIDPQHIGWWMGERWQEDGDRRSCLWCGEHEEVRVRWSEVVQKERWQSASAIEARSDATGTGAAVGESAGPQDDAR